MFSQLAPFLMDGRAEQNEVPEPAAVESLADLLYEIGKDLWQKRDYQSAVQWLKRAHDALATQDLGGMSPDATDLRCSIMHYLGE